MSKLDLKNADPRLVARAIDYAGGESAARAALAGHGGGGVAGGGVAGVFAMPGTPASAARAADSPPA